MADNTIFCRWLSFPPTRKMIFSIQLYFWMQEEEEEEEEGEEQEEGKVLVILNIFFCNLASFSSISEAH